jgi:hypothetical protein
MMSSMDMSVEEYLAMNAFSLLVWTRWLQDPSHSKLRETYLSLSIGLGKAKYSDLADWYFRVNGNMH